MTYGNNKIIDTTENLAVLDISTKTHPEAITVVDKKNLKRILTGPRWSVVVKDGVEYAARKIGDKTQYLHRFILNEPEGRVDHKSGNTKDNREDNLREVSVYGHTWNKGAKEGAKVSYKGVDFVSTRKGYKGKKYRARIRYKKKEIHLGVFDKPEDAAKEYDAMAKLLFGEYARLNFPEE